MTVPITIYKYHSINREKLFPADVIAASITRAEPSTHGHFSAGIRHLHELALSHRPPADRIVFVSGLDDSIKRMKEKRHNRHEELKRVVEEGKRFWPSPEEAMEARENAARL
jgi:hypothetical protein